MDESPAFDLPGISPSIIKAVAERAGFLAGMLNETIANHFTKEELSRGSFAQEQLLELRAAMQIRYWENNGVSLHVEHGLPTYDQAIQSIESQEAEGAAGFNCEREDSLSFKVMKFWLERFSWTSQEEWGTDIIVGSIDEDAFVELFAKYLLENSAELLSEQNRSKERKSE